MRGGIFKKLKRIALSILFLSETITVASAQEIPDEIISVMEENGDELTESFIESITETLEYYYSHPLRINDCNRKDLEGLGILSLFQIESIIDYRNVFGDILSKGELAEIDGFNPQTAAMISPFIDFSSDYSIGDVSKTKAFDTELIIKGKKKWSKAGTGLSSKLLMNYGRHSAGLILDSDAGERLTRFCLPDFTSAYYQYDGRVWSIVIGNYTARFGQGLVIWKAFPVSFAGNPSSIAKKTFGVKGYSSMDEDNYLRGMATAKTFGRGNLSIFISSKPVDARIKDGKYTSIVTGGIHSTESELSKRHTMSEFLAGANYNISFDKFRIGLTAVTYLYDKENGRRVAEYNKYQMYDGIWGNVGFDIYGFGRRVRYFAEAAVDAHCAPAALAGIIWSPEYELEMSILARYYDKKYIATHAAPYSTQSSVSNQTGLSYGVKWLATDALTLNASSDFTYYPWKRYGKDYSSYAVKQRFAIEYKNSKRYILSSRVTISLQSGSKPSFTFKNSASYAISEKINAETCFVVRQRGYAAYAGFTFTSDNSKIQASARLTGYDVKDWESRVSLYEKGMPQTYSLETFYGKGWSAYAMVKYAPNYKCRLYIKLSDRYSAFLIRIFIPG